ncbi:unnamed protein product [Adineta ricciae]|uniref:G-protein coupled receptors family 1 profile domain-containing protein n=1 Tax=Adineta ricciae TaxID=249248 RepID=A0A814IXM9_ADIRI|nr:unnamed protein product [Adineta ricciae]CAF1197449.1 unnamed protein product [Adineta ricciae]
MSSTDIATSILFVSKQLAIYGYLLILIAGVIGNIMNILVFSCYKLFRRNHCAFYLLAQTIIDCCLLVIALSFRILELAFTIDYTRTSVVWCKLRPMIAHTLTLLTFSAICFAAIDQYLSTNYHAWLRQMSTFRLSRGLVYISIIVWILYDSIFLFFFELHPDTGCNIYNADFSKYYSFFHYIILNGFIPILISTTFSVLAYLNVRRIVQMRMQVVRRKLDKQLTAMVLAKVASLVSTVLPSIVFRIYVLNVTVNSTDTVRIAIHQLVSNIAYALFYINPACTFYLFILVSSRFRRQIRYTFAFLKGYGRRCCRLPVTNQIVPANDERSEFE